MPQDSQMYVIQKTLKAIVLKASGPAVTLNGKSQTPVAW